METTSKTVKNFLAIAMAEGVSYLVLLGIAMPLKYWAGMPMAVKLVGWAHGVLFVAYMILLALAASRHKWPLQLTAFAFIASLLPFGTFVLEKRIRNTQG